MKTLLKQTLLFTPEELTSLQEDSLVSPTQPQDLGRVKKTNATYGPKCLEQLEKSVLVGLWAKTFAGLLIGGGVVFEDVCADLENQGYEVQAFIIPAASVNSLHKRERIFFIAYSECAGLEYRNEASNVFKQEEKTLGQEGKFTNEYKANRRELDSPKYSDLQSEYIICRGVNGISGTLDGITFPKWRKESIKAYGNAVVPQVIYEIFKSINTFESIRKSI